MLEQIKISKDQSINKHMMSPLEVAYQLLIMLVVPLLLLLHLASRSASRRRRPSNEDGNTQKLPPSPPALPIIGHQAKVI